MQPALTVIRGRDGFAGAVINSRSITFNRAPSEELTKPTTSGLFVGNITFGEPKRLSEKPPCKTSEGSIDDMAGENET